MKVISMHEGELMNMKKMVRMIFALCFHFLCTTLKYTGVKLMQTFLSLLQLIRYQTVSNETEMLSEKLKQTERDLADIRKEANNYQNMLQQSQAQYSTLERKYSKIKKMLRDFQQRDRDMIQFQEYYLQHLQEKDTGMMTIAIAIFLIID